MPVCVFEPIHVIFSDGHYSHNWNVDFFCMEGDFHKRRRFLNGTAKTATETDRGGNLYQWIFKVLDLNHSRGLLLLLLVASSALPERRAA